MKLEEEARVLEAQMARIPTHGSLSAQSQGGKYSQSVGANVRSQHTELESLYN